MTAHRILIVEDQREVSRLLRTSLETLEHKLEIIEIPSGEEALLDSSRNRVDLLVADYRLPGMSGIELMLKVRGFHPDVKVILITGLTDPKVRREVANAGADAFFIKPVQIADFLDAVERALGLVETILPPEPIAPPDEAADEERKTLPDLLTGLRQNLEAKAVLLYDDGGRILARAGELPDSSAEVTLTVSLMSIFSAGQKIASLLGAAAAAAWHIFPGERYDVLFSPVGTLHALLVVGEGLAETARLQEAMQLLADSRSALLEALEAIGAAVALVEPAAPTARKAAEEARTEPLEDLEPLLKAKKKLKPQELDAFWEEAVDKTKAPTKPDMLSYEQAKQLGLTPDVESKKR
ncbi:MAG: response regulator [Anaerolineales bacterium]